MNLKSNNFKLYFVLNYFFKKSVSNFKITILISGSYAIILMVVMSVSSTVINSIIGIYKIIFCENTI